MEINLSFQQKSFLLPDHNEVHLFIIYDTNLNKVINFRLSRKRPPSLVDKARSVYSSIKNVMGDKNLNVLTLNNEKYFFNFDQKRFVDNYKKKFPILNTEKIDLLINFFLTYPIPVWNNETYSKTILSNSKIHPKVVVELFNLFLLKENNSFFSNSLLEQQIEERPFLFLDFDLMCKQSFVTKYSLKIKKQEISFLKNLARLKELQQNYLEQNLNNKELLNSYWLSYLTIEKTFMEEINCQVILNATLLPNLKEFECILLNAGLSIKKNKQFYSSFLKIAYFSMYCLGLDLNKIFDLKKDDLLKIDSLKVIDLTLKDEIIKRTISFETKQIFNLLKDDLEIAFCSNKVYTKANKTNITTKSLLTLINKDLETITQALELSNFKSDSLKISAIFHLLEKHSKSYVLEEFNISKSFLKRIETLYEMTK